MKDTGKDAIWSAVVVVVTITIIFVLCVTGAKRIGIDLNPAQHEKGCDCGKE